MIHNKSILSFLLTLLSSVTYSQFTDVINSNRPGQSAAAFSVGKNVFQAELGFYGIKEKRDNLYDAKGFGNDLSLRYGALLEQLEFNIDMQYQKDWYKSTLSDKNRSGFKRTIIGAKYLIYDPEKDYVEKKPNFYSWKANHKFSYRSFIPAVGIYAGLNLKLSDNDFLYKNEPRISPKIMLITQNQLGNYVFVTNIILDKITSEYASLGYVVTLTRGFTPRWSGFLENQYYSNKYNTDMFFRGGAAYLLKQNVQIDASISSNTKNTPSIMYAGFGLSWRFDENYEEVYSKVKKDKKAKDKKGDKDKKGAKKDKNEKVTPKKDKKRTDNFGND